MRIGIDLGGTKIEGIALDGSAEVARLRVDTPRGDYAATVDAVAALVSALEKRAGTGGSVGVGIPGTLSPENGLVKNANSVWLIGQPLQADLERALGRAVRIANDANCFAVSEAADGAGAGAEVVFGVIVGTGTGAGIVVRGELLTGANAIAGEWGHNPLPSPTDDERPGPVVLLRPMRVHRDVPVRARPPGGLRACIGSSACGARDRRGRRHRRSRGGGGARAVRVADGARIGQHHQRPRP